MPAKFHPSHIMVVDAGDCVNRHLAEYVDKHQECDGWVLRKGYMYREGSKLIFLNVKNFNKICGTSLIIKYDLYNLVFENASFYNHLIQSDKLQLLPFVGAVYTMGNGENILANNAVISQMKNAVIKEGIGKIIEKLLKYRLLFLTKSIVKNFGLYNLND